MENRLKERLTGAAILVALIVLLVPEIFRGQRDDAHPGSGGTGSEGAPLRSYTIDLSNKGSGPLQSTGDGVADNASKVPAVTPAPAAVSAPAPVPATVPTPVMPAPTPSAVSVEPRVPEPHAPEVRATQAHASSTRSAATAHASRAEQHAESSPSRAPASAPAPAPAAAAKAAGGGWSVQLGLFAKRENAERLSAEAHNKGFQTSISSDPKGQYRVRTAGVADHAGAESLAQRLKSAGYPAAIVAPAR